MSEQQHPITPPSELLGQWRKDAPVYRDCGVRREEWIATKSARWGYEQGGADIEAELQKARDEELKECEEWLINIENMSDQYVQYNAKGEGRWTGLRS